jgi:hypothetical protein
VRPLARQYKRTPLPGTPPDECQSWLDNRRELRVEIWRKLVLKTAVPNPNNQCFDVYAIYDPAFKQPWLLATPVALQPRSVRAIYTDR